jgi:predicted RNA polymerase sigma factor
MVERAAAGAAAAAERVARESYGRLLALLAARFGDLAAAEDALAEAFRAALQSWPERGVPDNPAAWLFTAARNDHLDRVRSAAERTRVELAPGEWEALLSGESGDVSDVGDDALPDRRLALMLACAHPAITEEVHAPLMLQTVLGLEAEVIARAFALPEATLAQRLVRAKRKIKEAGIRFAVPGRDALPPRLCAVLEAVYAAFAVGWDLAGDNPQPAEDDLADEARFLATLLTRLVPDDPEVLGLAALVTLAAARRAARLDASGRYSPLLQQDVTRWDRALIAQGEAWLLAAHGMQRIGRFQLEAAIHSAHLDRARSGRVDWPAVALLYEGLLRLTPSLGAGVGRALAVGQAQGAASGLAALEQLDVAAAERFQPYWAARAELLAKLGRRDEALVALAQAIALAPSAAVAAWLRDRSQVLSDRADG